MADFKGFRVNSNYGSVARLKLERFVFDRRIRQLGWTLSHFFELSGALQTALQKFEQMTGHQTRFDLIFQLRHKRSPDALFTFNPEKKEIRIYLLPGPREVMAEVPPQVAWQLAHLFMYFYTHGRALTSGVHFQLSAERNWIEPGLKMINSFYLEERGLQLDRGQLKDLFMTLVEHYGLKIVEWKLAYRLLNPHFLPARHIEREIDRLVADFTAKVTPSLVDPREVPLWSMIAYMAMMSTLAKRYGAPFSYIKCQSALSGDNGRNLAALELLQVSDRELDYFRQYPMETEKQLRLAPASYNVVFNAFHLVFQYYFDQVTIS
jgi:hypothetical protein